MSRPRTDAINRICTYSLEPAGRQALLHPPRPPAACTTYVVVGQGRAGQHATGRAGLPAGRQVILNGCEESGRRARGSFASAQDDDTGGAGGGCRLREELRQRGWFWVSKYAIMV